MDTQEQKIGGIRYRMSRVGALTGRGIILRLGRPFAAFLSAAAASGKIQSLSDIGERELALALAPALAAVTEEDFAFCCDTFAQHTTVWIPDGSKVHEHQLDTVFDSHFAGRYGDMLAWFKWAVRFNQFFAVALESLAKSQAGGSSSASPPASTGGSGDSSQPNA